MSKEILQSLIENFDLQRFRRFFSEKNKKFRPSEDYLNYYCDDNFSSGQKLGELYLKDGNLIICAFSVKRELSERSGKKAQYNLGKGVLKGNNFQQFNAGIFIFYDKKENFRFSLIYDIPKGIRRDWNNFRRFTYFVSKEFTNKTFLQRIGDGDFSSLDKIKDAFSVEKVTKEFYKDIANWYFWAVQNVKFPKDAETEENGRNIAVIRLITRIIFIWFMRERDLVPKYLFEKKMLNNILKNTSPEKSTYYLAIIQNLFFATLNTKKTERNFNREKEFNKGKNSNYEDYNSYRYHELFKDSTKINEYFDDIPFLNGGLFECLDDKSNGIIVDGFSDNQKNQPLIPNYLFFSGELKADLNIEYGTKNKSYKVQGLIDTLSSYNFTIDENDLDDQEVALDPELLGRVFENLLASFNPETSTTARKATGSYYTPREIVNYMVTESLKHYFKTHLDDIVNLEEKLEELFSRNKEKNPFSGEESERIAKLIESLRIVDPAVGSGAFPMGVLNKLVFILNKVDPGNELWKQAQLSAVDAIPDPRIKQDTKNRIEELFKGKNADYGRKLYLIQKCIYGVDIQQIAVEIAKLRFFISLLVDEKLDKAKEKWSIEPLPNLDFKIMQGNSLISKFLGIDFDNGQKKQEAQEQAELGFENENDRLIIEFERKKIDYQNESDQSKRASLKNEVEDLMIKIFETKVKTQKADYFQQMEVIEQKYSLLPNKQSREEIIAKERQKLSQKTGFDLENIEKQLREFSSKKKTRPFFPWKIYFAEVFEKGGFDIAIANPPYIKEYTQKSAFNGLRSSSYYHGKMDLWYLFACKSVDFLKNNSGILAFIAQNNWVTSYGASILRNKVINETKILSLIDFGDYKIFESSGIQTMVMIFKKDSKEKEYYFDYRKLVGNNLEFNNVISILNRVSSSNAEYLYPKINRIDFIDKPLTFNNSEIENLLNKIKTKSNFKLDPIKEVAQGIVPNPDVISSSNIKKLNPKNISKYGIRAGNGVFVIPKDYFKKNLSYYEKSILKPLYEPTDLTKYYIKKFYSKEIIYLTKDVDAKLIPNFLTHLKKYREIMDSRRENLNGRLAFFHLHWPRDKYFFELGAKILSPRKCSAPTFVYTKIETYVMMSINVIKTERLNQKYLVALLNSKLIAFWLSHKGKMQGSNYQIDKEPLINLPLLDSLEPDKKSLIEIVDKILSITKSSNHFEDLGKQVKVKEYESQIDRMVYKLYDLTPEEIEIIENSSK